MNLILNQDQAEAVYSAMCALNNVGGRTDTFIEQATTNIHARELHDGRVVVHEIPHDAPKSDTTTELYANQSAFAAAYGLNSDDPQGQKYTTNRYCHANMCLESDQRHEVDCPRLRCVRSAQPQSDVAAAAGGLTQTAIER